MEFKYETYTLETPHLGAEQIINTYGIDFLTPRGTRNKEERTLGPNHRNSKIDRIQRK
jgi:hypothetical protein